MRILYFYRDDGVHDRRFLDALGQLPVEVLALQLENRAKLTPEWKPAKNVRKVSWSGVGDGFRWHQRTKLIKDLKLISQECHPDVVHAGPVDLCAYLAARAGLRPMVSMSWGFDLLVNVQKSLSSRRRARYALRRTAVLLDDCQAVSESATRLGFPSERIVTFPWGVDLQLYHPRDVKNAGHISTKHDQVVLLSTRQMEKQYGCDVIVNAFIKAAEVEKKLRLFILGEGSQKHRLMQQISKAGLDDRVQFAGVVPENEMLTCYHLSDVYVSASHSDGSSISLLQSMACGVPPIVSDIPGNREWIIPGRNGWLFADGDSDQLAYLMIEVSRSPESRAALGVAARSTTSDRADWKKNNPRLLSAYQMAIDYQTGKGANTC